MSDDNETSFPVQLPPGRAMAFRVVSLIRSELDDLKEQPKEQRIALELIKDAVDGVLGGHD